METETLINFLLSFLVLYILAVTLVIAYGIIQQVLLWFWVRNLDKEFDERDKVEKQLEELKALKIKNYAKEDQIVSYLKAFHKVSTVSALDPKDYAKVKSFLERL